MTDLWCACVYVADFWNVQIWFEGAFVWQTTIILCDIALWSVDIRTIRQTYYLYTKRPPLTFYVNVITFFF